MKNQITSRDIEQISAYLDNQLGARERSRFEARLKTDPLLKRELHEISKTRLLLRSLPKLRAPRNYYLKAAVPVAKPRPRLIPALGAISAVASVLLVLLIFGDAFYSPTSRVALAPASMPVVETTIVQEQAASSSAASAVSPTEAAPVVMMEAPLPETPTEGTGALKTGETGLPTPTTIYLFAMPPTSTPINPAAILQEQTEAAKTYCEDLANGTVPTPSYNIICPTPSGLGVMSVESVQPSDTPTPSETPTPSDTASVGIQERLPSDTSTTSPTPTPTDTSTPTLTATASPTPSPSDTPLPTQTSQPLINSAPAIEIGPSTQAPIQGLLPGVENPVLTPTQPSEAAARVTTTSSFTYIILAAEMSLAAIAIIAGVTAILLRIRSGR